MSSRYFTSHLKELAEPVEVTLQVKGTGEIKTIGFYYPKGTEPGRGVDEHPFEPKPVRAVPKPSQKK